MSLHDSRLVSPTESLVLGRAEARKRCSVCSNTFHDAACQSQEERLKVSFAKGCMNESLLCLTVVLNQSRNCGHIYFGRQSSVQCGQ